MHYFTYVHTALETGGTEFEMLQDSTHTNRNYTKCNNNIRGDITH